MGETGMVANIEVFGEPFLFLALGAWAAILVGFLGQVYDKVGYVTRLILAASILVHILGVLTLWLWAYVNHYGLPADGLAFAGVALPILGLVVFAIALVRRK